MQHPEHQQRPKIWQGLASQQPDRGHQGHRPEYGSGHRLRHAGRRVRELMRTPRRARDVEAGGIPDAGDERVSMRSARPARVSRQCSAALSAPPPARRAPFTVLSPQQAGTPPSPPPRPSAEDDMKNKETHQLPRLAAVLLGSFHPSAGNSLSGTPDGEPITACVAALAQVRAQSGGCAPRPARARTRSRPSRRPW
jgi:hypothetical protein